MTDELLTDATPPKKAAEVSEETLSVVRDATEKPDPKTFDFASFVAGIRPTRRAVTIYARGDLAAERDLLASRLREAEDAQAPAKERGEIRKRLKAITEEMAEGAIDVVFEGRSTEWRKKLNDALVADGVEDAMVRTSHIIAQQAVAPEGVTAELLEQIRAVSEPQWSRLTFAAADANNGEGVGPDFSRGRSGTNRR